MALTLPGRNLFAAAGADDHKAHAQGEDHAHAEEHADHLAGAAARLPEAAFADLAAFVRLPDAAGCALDAQQPEVSVVAAGEHAGHADDTATWFLTCAEPAALDALTMTAFDRGTGIERVEATLLMDGIAGAIGATPDDREIPLG